MTTPKISLTQRQRQVVDEIINTTVTLLVGPAGSGKTFLACWAANKLLNMGEIDKIVVVRHVAEAHGEQIGYLPGEIEDKMRFAMLPVMDNLEMIMGQHKVNTLVKNRTIEVIPPSFLRGRSLNRTAVIAEEVQNMAPMQILNILTRIGSESKVILTGDPNQIDYRDRNGVLYTSMLLDGIPDTTLITLEIADIARHHVVAAILEKLLTRDRSFAL